MRGSLRPDAAQSTRAELHSSAMVQALSWGLARSNTFSNRATQVSELFRWNLWPHSTHRPSQVRDVLNYWLPVTAQVKPPQVCPLREREKALLLQQTSTCSRYSGWLVGCLSSAPIKAAPALILSKEGTLS